MIIGLKSARLAFTRVIKMNANKNCILLFILNCDAIIKRDKDVGIPRHDGFDLGLAQFFLETLRYIERDHLFRRPIAAIRAAIFSAVPGIHDYGAKGFARVFNAWSSNGAASS